MDFFGLERWFRDYPSPLMGFPGWISVDLPPQIGQVTAASSFSLYASSRPDYIPSMSGAGYGMPSFVGSGGQCLMDMEEQWQCYTTADGVPFDDIRGYGIVQETNVEWFISVDSVASRGRAEGDLVYSIPELVGDAAARPSWIGVPYTAEEGVWVATNGYGVIQIDLLTGETAHHTTADGLPSDEVRDVLPCGPQCAWAATAAGVGYWHGVTWQAFTTADGLPSDDVRGISTWDRYDRQRVWAATAAGPAYYSADLGSWQSFPELNLDVNGVMDSIFSTRGQGLVRFIEAPVARGEVVHYTTADGLPSNQITALAETPNGILVGTPAGAVGWRGEWVPITDAAVNDAEGVTLGTDEGLWIWNGQEWEQVTEEPTLEVAQGGWFATSSQVCRWSWSDRAAECLPTVDGDPLGGVKVLSAYGDDSEIVVALAGDGEQWLYNPQAGHFVPAYTDFMPIAVQDVAASSDAWQYATAVGVYHSPRGERGGWAIGDMKLSWNWPVDVRQIRLDFDTGETWIATNQGAFYQTAYDPNSMPGWAYVAGLPSQNLSTVLPLYYDSALWFGTVDEGLFYFQPFEEQE
jgi:ligand-binding sensor domain-containing protein